MSGGWTPGPWRSTTCVAMHDRPDLPCVVDEFNLVVAQCWDDGHSEDECEANARLIAAAPDLVEALEGLIESFPDESEYELVQGGFTPNEARKLAQARAALAKAQGGAQ